MGHFADLITTVDFVSISEWLSMLMTVSEVFSMNLSKSRYILQILCRLVWLLLEAI